MFTLIGLGVFAAFVYSVAATVVPGWFPAAFHKGHGVEGYFETAVAARVSTQHLRIKELCLPEDVFGRDH